MYKTKLCLGTLGCGIAEKEQIELFKKIGFEGFFTNYVSGEAVDELKHYADEIGMIFQSVHARFNKIESMWGEDKAEAARTAADLIECAEKCSENEVPIMISHTWKGFGTTEKPNEIGVENFRKVAERAKELGVKIAFENTEGEEFLEKVMTSLSDLDNVGFCFDSGHESCYNYGRDMLGKYGDRLIATHINDNLGIKSFEGKTTWHDDLHLLPFDGIKDWEDTAKRIVDCGYDGIITFELSVKNKPGRNENTKYANMPFEEYVSEAYARACRVAALIQKYRAR